MSIFIGDNKVAGVGNPGRTGKPGESAYEIAKKYGYEGTEEEFALELSNAATKPDWLEEDENSPAFIRNKPEVFDQTQSDWLEEDENSPAFIKNKPEKFNSVINWNQNDPDGEGYIENRTHYDSRENIILQENTVNGTTVAWGNIKVADSIDFDIEQVTALTILLNEGVGVENIPITIVYDYQGYNLITPDDFWAGVYLETDEDADYWFEGEPHEGAGLYICAGSDAGQDVSFYYNLSYEVGELVKIDPKYIDDMYYDNSGEKDIIPLQTVYTDEEYPETYLNNKYIIINEEDYKVVIDNNEYNCVAYKLELDGDSYLYLGNPSLFNPDEFEDNGDQFVIVYNPVYKEFISLFATTGEHTVSVVGYAEDINKLGIKYDPTLEKNLKVIFSADEIYSYRNHALKSVSKLLIGDCQVIFDGVKERIAFVDRGWSTYAKGTGYELQTYSNSDGTIYLVMFCDDDENAHSLIIKQDIYTIKKELIPDGIGEIPDWNQNDESGYGYINNRTHWCIDSSETIIVPYHNIPSSDFSQMDNGSYVITNPFDFVPVEGDTYIIYFENGYANHLEFECKCNSDPETGIIYLGDTQFLTTNRPVTYPFLITYDGENLQLFMGTSTGYCRIIIRQETDSIVQQLDSKYIKDMYFEKCDTYILSTVSNIESNYLFYANGPLTIGSKYLVIYDGVEYECDACLDLGIIIGNISSDGYAIYPFRIEYSRHGDEERQYYFVFRCDDENSHDISIIKKDYEINQINPKYIEDAYYTENKTEILMPRTSFLYGFSLELCELIENESYIITFDDIEYELVCHTKDGVRTMGADYEITWFSSGYALTEFDWSIYPFSIRENSSIIKVAIQDYDNKHTISIAKKGKEIIHKIDPKYLPGDLGISQEEVQSMIDNAIGNAIGGSY